MVEDKFEVIVRGNVTYHLKNGKYHCEDGPAISDINGDEEWYIEGKLHREDGPAYIALFGRYQEWRFHGKLHRLDGPAVVASDELEWYYDNKKIHCNSQREFEKILKLKAFM